jgi:putative endonuclease
MASHSGVLYVGVTRDIRRRLQEHKSAHSTGFVGRYNVKRLVYLEETGDVRAALQREKQLKGWARRKKVTLIESVNPGWKDLSEG